jgi:hypothetical protein
MYRPGVSRHAIKPTYSSGVTNRKGVAVADIAAILAIVGAGLLSSVWVFVVPIFQATDEAAHYDYATGIFAAGHLITHQDRTQAWIATPYARYLLGATDYFRVAFHSSMRAPRGYGSPSYFHHLDASAPTLRPPIDSGKISYIGYPFGFYGLVAIVESVVASVTNSLTATFFGARLLCVFLTMIGLYFSYRAALNLSVPRWTAVALVIATGFFPLTTLVSSYVQPDNLSFALAAAALFLATQFERTARPRLTLCCIATVLGALSVTKYQFFVSVAAPVTLVVIFCSRGRVTIGRTIARAIALAIPAIAFLAIQFTIVSSPPWRVRSEVHAEFGASQGIFGTITSVFHSGSAIALSYFAQNSLNAFRDFYISGPNSATYWGTVGLWDVPIVIGAPPIAFTLRILISLLSLTVVAIIACRIMSNVARFGRIAARGRGGTALRLAFSDPLFNSYVLFTVLLFGLYAATANIFGAVGRQWYPYNFAAFLFAAWYAPRSFKGFARRLPGVLAAILALYSIVASAYATKAIVNRYYGPEGGSFTAIVPARNEIVTDDALGTLWTIQGMDFHPLFAKRYRTTFPLGSRLWAGGSAIFPASHKAADTVAVVIDGRLPARVLAGQYNFQIAEATRDLAYGYSGYFAPFNTASLTEGPHVAVAYAKLPDRSTFQTLTPTREFFLTAQGPRFSARFLRALNAVRVNTATSATFRSCGELLAIVGSTGGISSHEMPLVWAEAEGRPYPGTFDERTGRFIAAVPLIDFDPGRHSVSLYFTYPAFGTLRFAKTLSFNAGPKSSGNIASSGDATCTAAEHLIAGT